MTTFNVMIDDLGRIALPAIVRNMLKVNGSDSVVTLEIELDEEGKAHMSLKTNKDILPKEEEKKIYTFYVADECSKVIKISKEQDKFFNWLIDQDYFHSNVEICCGLPEVDIDDLTR